MNYKKMSIIFLIMLIPISVVLSEYVHNQIDTLSLQTQYKTMLNDSVYDAILSYEMNTMSTTVAKGEDNKRYVLASVNTFFNSLAMNMGISGTNSIDLRLYVPAILFTSYDGYYIYSPTRMPKVATDDIGLGVIKDNGDIYYLREGNESTVIKDSSSGTVDESKATTDMNDAKISYDYMLKPYVYYSASYTNNNNYNIVVNYSLDNYITVYGEANGESFTKSGYLLDYRNIVFDELYIKTLKTGTSNDYGEDVPKDINGNSRTIVQGQFSSLTGSGNVNYRNINRDSAENYINNYDEKSKYTDDVVNKDGKRFQTGDEIIKDSLKLNPDIAVTYKGLDITDVQAKEYYIKAYYFSKWIDENLGDIVKASNINEEIDKNAIKPDAGENNGINDQIKINFTSDDKIFDIYDERYNLINNPDSETSIFTNHRKSVIQNSILYSLNSAISTYSTNMDLLTENRLPIFSQSDWDKILSNIGMTVFLQGIPCGTKTFNDYAIVTSANNNQFVDKNNLYFTESIGGPNTTDYKDYHKIDCPDANYSEADISAQFKYDAREVEIRLSKDDYWYSNNTGKYYEKNPSDPSSTAYDNIPNSVEMYYFDEDTNTYYDSAWNPKTFTNNLDRKNFESVLQKGDGTFREITVYETGTPLTAYLYDHKNTGCYECIVSNNYTPVVKFDEDGEMRRTGLDTDGKLVMAIPDGSSREKWVYDDGTVYTGTVSPQIGTDELANRKTAWYTYLAKYRNNLYKTNAYVNR